MEEGYATVRELLGCILGRTVVEVTQHDEDEFMETGQAYISMHFDNGTVVTFPVGEDPVEIEEVCPPTIP